MLGAPGGFIVLSCWFSWLTEEPEWCIVSALRVGRSGVPGNRFFSSPKRPDRL